MEEEKKPYEKPAIVYHEQLEVLAGLCDVPSGKATVVTPCAPESLFT